MSYPFRGRFGGSGLGRVVIMIEAKLNERVRGQSSPPVRGSGSVGFNRSGIVRVGRPRSDSRVTRLLNCTKVKGYALPEVEPAP